MKIVIYSSLFVFLGLASCSKKDDTPTIPIEEQKSLEQPGLTYSDFATGLKADMTFDAIVAKFGAPVKDIGSGIHIYVYTLTDGTEIYIGYANKIIYARHVDSNRTILHTII